MKEDINQLKSELSKLKDKSKDSLLDREKSTDKKESDNSGEDLSELKDLIRELKYDLKEVEKDTKDNKKEIKDVNNDVNRIRDDTDSIKKELERLMLLINLNQGGGNKESGDSGNQNMLKDLLNELDSLRNKLK